jgi:hypothetical protein
MDAFPEAVMAGLVPATPIVTALRQKIEVAGTSPATTAHV